jgi:hypothetical protein
MVAGGVTQPARSPDARPVAVPGRWGVDLYWIPLGSGGRGFVRFNGRVYEAVMAALKQRPRLDLYHTALTVHVPEGSFVIEMTPIVDPTPGSRGVVVEGPVGSRLLGRLRLFRYEIRRWHDGVIPDAGEAVASPQRLIDEADRARHLLDLVAGVPPLVWGRDESRAGEMWSCNSITSWLLASSGVPMESARPPAGGRAPGWDAGIVVARQQERTHAPAVASARSASSKAGGRTISDHNLPANIRTEGLTWRPSRTS